MDNQFTPNYSLLIAEVTNSAVWEWDLTTNLVKINRRWAEIIGYTKEELEPVTIAKWESFVHPDDIEISNRELRAVFNKEKEFYNAEVRIRHKDGHYVHIFDSGKVVLWSNEGKPLIAVGTHIDITDNKKIDQEYKRLAILLKEIIDNTHDIIYRTDGKGTIQYLSDSVTKNLGFDKTLSLGLFLHDFIHPDDLAVFTKYFDSVYDKTHKDEPLAFRIKHKDGSWRTFETVASPLFEDRVFAGYVGVARDISQLVEKDRELKEQKEELDRFFKVNLDLFCITDDKGRLLKVNQAWEVILGYPLDYLINKPLMKFVHPDDVDITFDVVKQIINNNNGINNFVNRYRKIDGTYISVEWNAITYNGFVYGSGRNITRRIEAQRQMLKEKEHFRTTLMSVGDGIIVTDEKGRITEMNPTACKLTGYGLEEAIGRDIDDIYKLYDENNKHPILQLVATVFKKKTNIDLSNVYLLTKCGKEILIDDSIAPILDQDGHMSGVVIAFRDVSEVKERQRKIEYLSYHDQLTDLYNRHYLDRMQKEINKRTNYPLAIISLDLNDLKKINDHFGHYAGDMALKKTANAIKKHVNQRGYSFRIGGDEFLVILPKTSQEEAEAIVRIIVKDIEKKKSSGYALSIATGLSVLEAVRSDIYHAIKYADDRMYADKLRKKSQG